MRSRPGWSMRRLAGAWFRLYRTPYAGTAQHTIAGWEVEDIEVQVAELKARGVVFEESHF